MKDESKAQWPELSARKNVSTASMNDRAIWYIESPLNIEITLAGKSVETEARAKQICALPEIVALLKELYESGDLKTSSKAYIILRNIGEVE